MPWLLILGGLALVALFSPRPRPKPPLDMTYEEDDEVRAVVAYAITHDRNALNEMIVRLSAAGYSDLVVQIRRVM